MKKSTSLPSSHSKDSIFEENSNNPSSQNGLFFRDNQDLLSRKSESFRSKDEYKKKKNQVFLEGYVDSGEEDELSRTRSLTDDDLDELKGCLDLGFGFNYEEIPELCNTLPALELCYSMSQKYLDEQQKSNDSMSDADSSASSSSSPIPNWKISSPGDDPEDVKARLKYWAQAVACTVKLCS
ncbi:hypothetical protein LIER_30845 [Lithospermum erythrorhizon]|uniref:Uncharacterized protein n=1 Tax=Lithospermum erythrorhizon TaxID=34254 RepID=A0AAV3RS98_LITER